MVNGMGVNGIGLVLAASALFSLGANTAQAAQCKGGKLSVKGRKALASGRAQASAKRRWRRVARRSYGRGYSRWRKAKGADIDCDRRGRRWVCKASAYPCWSGSTATYSSGANTSQSTGQAPKTLSCSAAARVLARRGYRINSRQCGRRYYTFYGQRGQRGEAVMIRFDRRTSDFQTIRGGD